MTLMLLFVAAGSHLKSFLSGGVGGIMAVLVGHPFDLGKFVVSTRCENVANVP